MTEPVAYKVTDSDSEREYLRFTPSPFDKNTPLYTAEQLHPRVKMTKEQWDEFNEIRNESLRFSDLWRTVFEQGKAWHSIVDLSEKNLMLAWLNDETVEIVPDMKWFVVRKLPNTGGNMLKCSKDGLLTYNVVKEAATQFDTKEEAEKWTNPLTEAVQLPVEGE